MYKKSTTIFLLSILLCFGGFLRPVRAAAVTTPKSSSVLTASYHIPLPPTFAFGVAVDDEQFTSEEPDKLPIPLTVSLGIEDPLQGFNRVMFAGNDFLIMWVIRPVSTIYDYIIPLYFRERIGNIYDNLQMPRRVLSNLCRGRWNSSGIEFYRFLINTTVGIAGAYDPAMSWWQIAPQPSDFGAAFADWGFKHGAYIVLPIQGSTSVRDGIGLIFDTAADPLFWISWFLMPFPVSIGVNGGLRVNGASMVISDYERLHDSSIDLYITMRNYWYLRRVYEINR